MDINQVISLGIGTPADIPHFILFGLSPTGGVAVPTSLRFTHPMVGSVAEFRAASLGDAAVFAGVELGDAVRFTKPKVGR